MNNLKTGLDFVNYIIQNKAQGFVAISQNPQLKEKMYDALTEIPLFDEDCNPHGFAIAVDYVSGIFEDDPHTYVGVYIFDPERQKGDWWRGSISQDYKKAFGNEAAAVQKTYLESTNEQLAKVGWIAGENYGAWAGRVLGEKIHCWVAERDAKTGKKYYVVQALGRASHKAARSIGSIFGAPPSVQQMPAFQQPQTPQAPQAPQQQQNPSPAPQQQPQQQQQNPFA